MTTNAMARARAEPLIRPGRTRCVGAVALSAVLGSVAFSSATGNAAGGPANGVRICGERNVLLEQFALQHDETPQALGLGADGGLIEVLVSPEGGWTMLVTYPERPTCVVAMGQAWETLQLAGDPT